VFNACCDRPSIECAVDDKRIFIRTETLKLHGTNNWQIAA